MSCPTLLTKVHDKLALSARVSVAAILMLFVVLRTVNVLKGKVNTGPKTAPSWDDESVFDQEKEKDGFRQYDDACDHVKEFYREQHGTHSHFPSWPTEG